MTVGPSWSWLPKLSYRTSLVQRAPSRPLTHAQTTKVSHMTTEPQRLNLQHQGFPGGSNTRGGCSCPAVKAWSMLAAPGASGDTTVAWHISSTARHAMPFGPWRLGTAVLQWVTAVMIGLPYCMRSSGFLTECGASGSILLHCCRS